MVRVGRQAADSSLLSATLGPGPRVAVAQVGAPGHGGKDAAQVRPEFLATQEWGCSPGQVSWSLGGRPPTARAATLGAELCGAALHMGWPGPYTLQPRASPRPADPGGAQAAPEPGRHAECAAHQRRPWGLARVDRRGPGASVLLFILWCCPRADLDAQTQLWSPA